MKYEDFDKFRSKFFEIASKVSDSKSIEYTISNEDKFYNFKHVAERLGTTSPAFPDLDCTPGAPFDAPEFPVLYSE